MIAQQIRQLKTGPSDLRKFGISVGGVLVLLGCWLLFRHRVQGPYLIWPGSLLVLLGLVAPRILKQVYVVWMTIGFVLGLIVSTLLLTLFFYLALAPIGLAARLLGKDFLERKWDKNAPSYWRKRDSEKKEDPMRYEQQF